MGIFSMFRAEYDPNKWKPRYHIPASDDSSLVGTKKGTGHSEPHPYANPSPPPAAGDTRPETAQTPEPASPKIDQSERPSDQRGHTPATTPPPPSPLRGKSPTTLQRDHTTESPSRATSERASSQSSTEKESDLDSHVFRMIYGYEGVKHAAAMGGLSEQDKNALGNPENE